MRGIISEKEMRDMDMHAINEEVRDVGREWRLWWVVV